MRKVRENGGKRFSVGFRVTAETRGRIAAAAASSGRSIAQELEARFDASLVRDDLRTLIREELRAELRAELRSEIRAALEADRQAERERIRTAMTANRSMLGNGAELLTQAVLAGQYTGLKGN